VALLLAEQANPSGLHSSPPLEHFSPCTPTLGSFREAVSDLVAEVGECAPADARAAEHILANRLGEDEIATVLEETPDGWDATVARLLFEVRNYEPTPQNATTTLASLVRISLLSQIDAVWWGREPCYLTDSDLAAAMDLVDLDELNADKQLTFRYRHQAVTLLGRAARSAERHTMPRRRPKTAGILLALARPQVVAWLNDVAEEFAEVAPDGTPPLWVTSVARSVDHQRHLKALGYIAPLPSSHCVGYAADIEMKWYRRYRAHRLLRGLLLDRQRAHEINVIDEGQAWHVCLRPDLVASS
jgi:hypothetical protein